METGLVEKIKEFLSIDHGHGCGYDSGSGGTFLGIGYGDGIFASDNGGGHLHGSGWGSGGAEGEGLPGGCGYGYSLSDECQEWHDFFGYFQHEGGMIIHPNSNEIEDFYYDEDSNIFTEDKTAVVIESGRGVKDSSFGYGSGSGVDYSELGFGYGRGFGKGYGFGEGYGFGDSPSYVYGYICSCEDGKGTGDGDSSGSGYLHGDGDGFILDLGYGITEFNDHKVWNIDSVATIITNIRDNIAQGYILNTDFTLTPCYVVKVGNYFAHGKTVRDAYEDAYNKALKEQPIEERIEAFKDNFPNKDEKIPAKKLSEWHNTLTGSCRLGREQFVKEHGINLDTDSFTVEEFINLTKKEYGSNVIKKLSEAYKIIV